MKWNKNEIENGKKIEGKIFFRLLDVGTKDPVNLTLAWMKEN